MEYYSQIKGINNIPMLFKLTGDLDVGALKHALDALVKRHDMLRVQLVFNNNKPAQVVHTSAELNWAEIDCKNQERASEEAIEEIVATSIETVIELETPSWLKVRLYSFTENEYYLSINLHHAIVDGWSCGIFFNDLRELYLSFRRNLQATLTKSKGYAQYVAWQQKWLASEKFKAQLRQRADAIKSLPMTVDMPTDHPRPKNLTYTGTVYFHYLSKELSAELLSQAQEKGHTLYISLLTIYYVLLSKMSGQNEIVLGTTVANRTRAEFRGTMGLLMNSIPLPISGEHECNFEDLFQVVKQSVLDGFDAQGVPFERVVDALKLPRCSNIHPVFQYMLTLQNVGESLSLDDLDVQPLDKLVNAEQAFSRFDLNLVIEQTKMGLRLGFNYSLDLFSEETIIGMANYFERIANCLVTNSRSKIKSIELLSKQEKSKLLENNRKIFNTPGLLHQVLEESAMSIPDSPYLFDNKGLLSYSQVNVLANQLARHLIEHGVTSNSTVAVIMSRSAEAVITFFAIIKAGAHYLYIDPANPSSRISYLLQDAGACVMVASKRFISSCDQASTCEVLTYPRGNVLDSYSEQNLDLSIAQNQSLYLLYTSGSTGLPKGVKITHANVMNYLNAINELAPIRNAKRIAAVASFAFDISVFDLYYSLLNKGTVYIVGDEAAKEPLNLMPYFLKHRINCINATPSFYNLFLLGHPRFGHKTVFMSIGEKLLEPLARKLLALGSVVNAYGPTECTVAATAAIITDPLRITIGKPLANIKIYVLDDVQNLVPVGVIGELCLAGVSLASGYLNRPAQTRSSFIDNPFDTGKLYRTGDYVRLNYSGEIEYIGRKDNQVKLHGFRIELSEVENCLCSFPQVVASVVVLKQRQSGEDFLLAYVTLDDNKCLSLLQHFIRERLPAYMLPQKIIVLEKMPYTTNGKIDKANLPEPEAAKSVVSQNAQPKTPLHKLLCNLVAKVLRLPKIGIDDDFFALGGDSIMCLQLIHYAAEQNVYFPLSAFFENPTIRLLSDYLQCHQVTPAAVAATDVIGTVPLTPIQQYFFHLNLENINHNNQSIILDCSRRIDFSLLVQVTQRIINFHDMLRADFTLTQKGWEQAIISATDYFAKHKDIVQKIDVGEDPSDKQLFDVATKVQRSLNIETGKLIQFALLECKAGSQRLLIVVHHLVTDGTSMRIIAQDLMRCYMQLYNECEVTFPHKTSSFQQWANKLIEFADSNELQSEVSYWSSMHSQSAAILPTDFNKGAHTIAKTRYEEVALSEEQTSKLFREGLTNLSANINDVLITALVSAYSRTFQADKLCFSLDFHGRDLNLTNIDLSRTVGWFTAIFPTTIPIDSSIDALSLLDNVKAILATIPRGGGGYGILKYLSTVTQAIALKKQQIPQLRFNYLGRWIAPEFNDEAFFNYSSQSSGLTVDPDSERAFLLDINAEVKDGKLIVGWRYSSNHFYPRTIKRFCNNYFEALQRLISGQVPALNPGNNELGELVLLNQSKALPGLYCVHPIGGQIHWYWPLAKRLAVERAFYGIKINAADYCQRSISVEMLAASYLSLIKRRQPDGPTILMGWSFGALVAFEMAYQLEQCGELDYTVIMIDPPDTQRRWLSRQDIMKGLGFDSFSKDKSPFTKSLHTVEDFLHLDDSEQLTYLLEQVIDENIEPHLHNGIKTLLGEQLVNARAMWAYRPKKLIKGISLLLAEDTVQRYDDFPDLGWGQCTDGRLQCKVFKGDHYSILAAERLSPLVNQIKNMVAL